MSTKDFLSKVQSQVDKSNGADLSALLEERKNVLNLKLLVGVDISGSISQNQFKQFMGQLDGIRGLSVVKVAELDTRIQALYDYYRTEGNRVIRLGGGGGTILGPVFDLAKQVKADAVLLMTDGFVGDAGQVHSSIPTGYILTNNGVQPYNFGEIVHILK